MWVRNYREKKRERHNLAIEIMIKSRMKSFPCDAQRFNLCTILWKSVMNTCSFSQWNRIRERGYPFLLVCCMSVRFSVIFGLYFRENIFYIVELCVIVWKATKYYILQLNSIVVFLDVGGGYQWTLVGFAHYIFVRYEIKILQLTYDMWCVRIITVEWKGYNGSHR